MSGVCSTCKSNVKTKEGFYGQLKQSNWLSKPIAIIGLIMFIILVCVVTYFMWKKHGSTQYYYF